MADYKVTDTELTSIANAIRTKGGTQAQLEWPSGFISAIQAIPTGGGGVTIVPWSTGTDAEIAAMVEALDAGTLSIADTGWQIGDERIVSLTAMAASTYLEAHAAQDVTLVLMDSQHYDLVGGGKDHFVVALKNGLVETGYMNYLDRNEGSWDGSMRRTWCNETFRMAIPETLRACFKQFQCITIEEYNGSANKISNDYFALFAEKEVSGNRNRSNAIEANALSQIAYYSTPGNRIKTVNGSNSSWLLRSPDYEYSNSYCYVNSGGNTASYAASASRGIAPFGCI